MKWLLTVVAVAMLLAAAALESQASLLSDWFGVELSVGGRYSHFTNSWDPVTSTAEYFVDDNWSSWHGSAPSGGEMFDIEAMYFDNDETNAYIAVVTSLRVPWGYFYHGEVVVPGDLSIGLDDGLYDVGIDVDGRTGLVADTEADNWYQANTMNLAEQGPTNFTGGVALGFADINYYDYGLRENRYSTYVLEMTVPLALLGRPAAGSGIDLRWTMGCRNDLINLHGTIGDGSGVIPEPGTLVLLGSGLIGLAATRLRRKK